MKSIAEAAQLDIKTIAKSADLAPRPICCFETARWRPPRNKR